MGLMGAPKALAGPDVVEGYPETAGPGTTVGPVMGPEG